jgi:fibronectin-binding autotransporter adhesin
MILCGLAVLALAAGPPAQASLIYWDTNGTTAGSGAATGTWGTSAYWSTSSAGTAATANTTITNADDVFFSAGTTGTTGTVTIGTTKVASSINFDDNVAITLSGGTSLTIGGTGTKLGIFVISGDNAANSISTPLILNTASTIQTAGTGVLSFGPSSKLTTGSGTVWLRPDTATGTSRSSSTRGR